MHQVFVGLPRGLAVVLVAAVILAGCSSTSVMTPVEEKSPNAAAQASAPATVQPAPASAASGTMYVVKKGDTLYSIALQFGQDYRQIAQWNGIDQSYVIHVGQSLQVSPPEPAQPATSTAVAQAMPVAGGVIEQRPIGSAPPAPVASGDAPLKTGPLGQKRPYSDEALAELSQPDVAPTVTSPPPPATPTVAPAAGVAMTPVAPAASAPDDDQISLIWPVAGPILSGYSADGKNKGIDIGGKTGTPVVAAADGTVLYAGNGIRGYGNLVVIKHSATLTSVYANNSKLLVSEQQSVKKGQKIAEMGDSDADRVHLHFEIRKQGKPEDPMQFLPPR